MNVYVPRQIFFTKRVGLHKEELHSFENITHSSIVQSHGFTTVIAVAVFVF